jgi:membrane protease subunit HflC
MNPKMIPIVIVVIVLAAVVLAGSIFTVDETEQAIVTQLGKYVRTVRNPGLHFKIPFVQTPHKFEDRVLEYDAAVAKVITSDKKHLMLDNYARWRIVDPLKFYQTVRTQFDAQSRLDDIVFSEIREEVARHEMTDIISKNREAIMEEVGKQCNAKAAEYGIEVIDIRFTPGCRPNDSESQRDTVRRVKRKHLRHAPRPTRKKLFSLPRVTEQPKSLKVKATAKP